ncbi:BQ5605_C002g01746 [Microbotryum silenes-dioicae]|uniref:Palmitoyltransferase n=1 Tax=Microbotryum silenes-dioicae TaxID=796604 RepID=A0A2X0LZM6_9BASI|nr:BQ5605_C002g01746 [Microbotryum silenes-dioicae]
MTLEHAASRALVAAQESTRLIDTQTRVHAPGNTDSASARRRRARSRWTRPNVILGKLIPPLLIVLAYKGYALGMVQTANYLALVRGRHSVARMYQLQFIVLLSVVILCFGLVRFASHRIDGDGEPPIEVQQRKVVCPQPQLPRTCVRNSSRAVTQSHKFSIGQIFECNSDGKAKMCNQCKRWRPVKARHCNDCGVCIPGFDHHCPFMDACIAIESIKPFFCFLVVCLANLESADGFPSSPLHTFVHFFSGQAAVLLIGISIIPLLPIIYEALMRVLETTWDSVELRERWWDRKLSWIGGPVTRYAYGIFIAYRVYGSSSHPPLLRVRGHQDPTYDPCPLLSSPHFGPLLVVVTAVFVMLVGIAMITTIILNARQGLSAVQVERIRRHRARSSSKSKTYNPRIYIYLPPAPRTQTSSLSVLVEGEQNPPEEGVIIAVDPEEPLFDLGASKNLEALLGQKWWEWGMPWRRSRIVEGDEMFNPKVITQLREKARKQP